MGTVTFDWVRSSNLEHLCRPCMPGLLQLESTGASRARRRCLCDSTVVEPSHTFWLVSSVLSQWYSQSQGPFIIVAMPYCTSPLSKETTGGNNVFNCGDNVFSCGGNCWYCLCSKACLVGDLLMEDRFCLNCCCAALNVTMHLLVLLQPQCTHTQLLLLATVLVFHSLTALSPLSPRYTQAVLL